MRPSLIIVLQWMTIFIFGCATPPKGPREVLPEEQEVNHSEAALEPGLEDSIPGERPAGEAELQHEKPAEDAELQPAPEVLEPTQAEQAPDESEFTSLPAAQELEEELLPELDPSFKGRINDDKPYVVIAGSYEDREDAAEKVAKLDAAWIFSEIEDSRSFENFACCYNTVVAGRFESREEAKERSDILNRVGFRAYVKKGFEPIDAFDDYQHRLLYPAEIPPKALPGHFTHAEAKEWVELRTEELESRNSTGADGVRDPTYYRTSLILYHQEDDLVARTELLELAEWSESEDHSQDWYLINTLVNSESGREALVILLDYSYACTENNKLFVIGIDDLNNTSVLLERTGLIRVSSGTGMVEMIDFSVDDRINPYDDFEDEHSFRVRLRDGYVRTVEHGQSSEELYEEGREICEWEEGVLKSCALFKDSELVRECGPLHCDEEALDNEAFDEDEGADALDAPPVQLSIEDFAFPGPDTFWGPACQDYFNEVILLCKSEIEFGEIYCQANLRSVDYLLSSPPPNAADFEVWEEGCRAGIEAITQFRSAMER